MEQKQVVTTPNKAPTLCYQIAENLIQLKQIEHIRAEELVA